MILPTRQRREPEFWESRLDDWVQFGIDVGVGMVAGSVLAVFVFVVAWLLGG